jgi:oxygen-independent coproporphyrinogen-3 oxidase
LEDAGYIHYEISNFARNENLRSKHNMKYWRHAPYLGLGPAAHSFFGNKRWWNKSAVKTYIKDVSAGKIPMESSEELSAEQLQLETLFLGLRTKEGIDLQLYKAIYGKDLLEEKKLTIDSLLKDNLVEVKNDFLRPKLAGMAVADSLALI